MRRTQLPWLLLTFLLLSSYTVPSLSSAATGDPLATAQVTVQGNRLTLYDDGVTTDAEQTINVDEPARVRTCYGGVDAECGVLPSNDPRIAGLKVRAELRGPGLPEAIPMETVPGGSFILPGFQQQGDYYLENIRLVNEMTDVVMGEAEPAFAVIHVCRIVLASATVTTLSLEQLRERGIALTEESFQAFNFAVGFAFGESFVTIDFPVIYEGSGTVTPLSTPSIVLDDLPDDVIAQVVRWSPPMMTMFRLDAPEEELLEFTEEENEELSFPMLGAIVLPGTVTFLNQFFDAQLIVANGAPPGAEVNIGDLTGVLRMPSGNVLRLVATEPQVVAGTPVPLALADGGRIVTPGNQASATWMVEGLAAGSHMLSMEISGQLERPGRDPYPVASSVKAVVEVVDARFHLTFAHPDTVRKDERYSLFVTITNMSRVTQNLVTLALSDTHMTGAHPADPNDTMARTVEVLEPGQSETVEFRLVAELTGEVVATTFQSSTPNAQGTIELYTGVGELGIPLSPATLILPRFANRLQPDLLPDDEYLRANVNLLGLAYSLAVAPAGMAPNGLPRVIRSDVEQRAVDLAEAGQRIFLKEQVLESLEVLMLDGLGNRHPLAEFDELRRRTEKGLIISRELSELLQWQQIERNLDATELLDHLAETTSYTSPYIAAVIEPSGSAGAPELVIQQAVDGTVATVAGACTDDCSASGLIRDLPFAEIYTVSSYPGSTATGQLAVVGHVDPSAAYELRLVNPGSETLEGTLVVVVPDGATGDLRRIELGPVSLAPSETWAVMIGGEIPETGDGFRLYNPGTSLWITGAPGPSFDAVERPPFEIVGAVQDYLIDASNRYGHGVSYLFNRPPDPESATDPSSWAIISSFIGEDTAGGDVDKEVVNPAAAAFVQPSGRVVNVRYTNPMSSLFYPDNQTLVVTHRHDESLMTSSIYDDRGAYLSAAPDPEIDPETHHVGGLVGGRVIRGNGEGAVGAAVQLIRKRTVDGALSSKLIFDLVGETTTDSNGEYYFDYVESPFWQSDVDDMFTLRATVPALDELSPAVVEEVSSVIRLQNKMARINIALLGRGTVTGHLVYEGSGDPVPEGKVTIASTLFGEMHSVDVDETDGSFTIAGMPVGPLTLTGSDEAGRRVYATVGLEKPGDTVEVLLQLHQDPPGGTGTVIAKVMLQPYGDPLPPAQPLARADVAIYADGRPITSIESNSFGNVVFRDVPAGRVTLQAAHWGVSRTAVLVDLTLAPGEEANVILTIPESGSRTVFGQVSFYDPTTGAEVPVQGAVVFVDGISVYDHTDADGRYRLEGIPVQGAGEEQYRVTAIDYGRKLQGSALLQPINDETAPEVEAQEIVLREMKGGISGVVHSPLGLPQGGVSVVAALGGIPYVQTTTGYDGSFSFANLPLGEWRLTAHIGDGLDEDQEGYFGETNTEIVFGGHTPFAAIRMVGAGKVQIHVTVSSATGIKTPIYYKPTYYSESEKSIRIKGAYIETETTPNGDLALVLPVGAFEIVAYSPFSGVKEVHDRIEYAGQIKNLTIQFEDSSTVTGTVVDVDGVTPLEGIDVEMSSEYLKGQHQVTDAYGRFLYELVPKGGVQVRAHGMVGAVERFGVASGTVTMGGQTLELTVKMRPQITVEGQVLERVGSETYGLSSAQIRVRESSYPYRTFPAGGGWLATDGDGRYSIPNVAGGRVSIIARDGAQVSRLGSTYGQLYTDWGTLTMPDIFLTNEVGSLEILVRDPVNGAPLSDCQVSLNTGEMTVSDDQGRAYFMALPLTSYSAYAFHAPTGRSGRQWAKLSVPGENVVVTVTVDDSGKVRGTMFDDEARTIPVPNGTVQLRGDTVGGSLTALASTSSADESLGRFLFDGIPEGTFKLTGAINSSPRRAHAEVAVTEQTPEVDVALVLEGEQDLYVRLFERLSGGDREIHPDDGLPGDEPEQPDGLFSVRLYQGTGYDTWYDRTLLAPTKVYPDHSYEFADVLIDRSFRIEARELAGEQRSVNVDHDDVVGSGTAADPFRIVLTPKGVVKLKVVDGSGVAVSDAHVTLLAGRISYQSQTGDSGWVNFTSVPAGALAATAKHPDLPVGGVAHGSLVYDDDVISLEVTLADAVSVHGIVYEPVANDAVTGDTELTPAGGVVVILKRSGMLPMTMLTGEAGTASHGMYAFDGLTLGTYTVEAQSINGEAWTLMTVPVGGPNGADHELPPMILDASPPRILSLTPENGSEDVSLTEVVEIVFSEALHDVIQSSPGSFFSIRSASEAPAPGAWTTEVDPTNGRQVVRFTPSQPYENQTSYGVVIDGGSNGVRDQMGRPLSSSDIGSMFTTADRDGPKVIGTEPSLDRPVDPEAGVRFDMNEAVTASDGVLDSTELLIEWQGANGWNDLAVEQYYYTRSNYSVAFEPYSNVTLTGDTLLRRVTITGLEDADGNPMTEPGDDPWTYDFRIRDGNPPAVAGLTLAPPAGDGGVITSGQPYLLTPTLADIDYFATDDPEWGDIDRVEYYSENPDDPATQAQPIYSATSGPFAYSFIGPNAVGESRPLTIWVRAVDTSTNVSDAVSVTYTVLPNQPPTVASVTVAPLAEAFYAGTGVQATVSGIDDTDDSQLTVRAELRRDDGSLVNVTSGIRVSRPATGWGDLTPLSFELEIPLEMAEGTGLYVQAEATDPGSARGYQQSAGFTVAHDVGLPVISDLQVVSLSDGRTNGPFYIGERLRVELRASDAETDVASVQLTTDRTDIFPAEVPVHRVSAGDSLYRSDELVVPHDVFTEETPVTLTATATDFGANLGSAQLTTTVAPESDPIPPTVSWLTPWQGAPWPADYSWVFDPSGTRILVRLRAEDTSIDPDTGEQIAGRIVTVEVRGPVIASTGIVELGNQAVTAEPVSGSDGIYQALWYVPNSIPAGTSIPFRARVSDSGGHEVLADVEMTAQLARQVYQGADTAVHADDLAEEGDQDGLVFLLDGSEISVYPRSDGSPLAVAGLCLYAGGDDANGSIDVHRSILTAPRPPSHDSLIQYYPLALDLSDVLAVGAACRIDVSLAGLLGSTSGASMVLAGETASERYAGGSHGGRGWYGSPYYGWSYTNLREPGSVYDSIRNPYLPGGGGGYGQREGGRGGGVVRIDAGGATVWLSGDLLADGQSCPPSAECNGGGGAGGAILLVAGSLDGEGLISASGGLGSDTNRSGGGGGGRIALYYEQLGSFDPAAQVAALGGLNADSSWQTPSRLAGAGTIYIEALDPAGTYQGELYARNQGSYPAATTPLPALGDGLIEAVDSVAAAVTLNVERVRGDLIDDQLVIEDESGVPIGIYTVSSQELVSGASGVRVKLGIDATLSELDNLAAMIAGGSQVQYHGRSWYVSVHGIGMTRLVADDDLEVGPEAGPLLINDRSSLDLDSVARVLLRGESPEVTINAEPASGADVVLGSSIAVSWSVNDPLGVVHTVSDWDLETEPIVDHYLSAPTSVNDSTNLSVPFDATPGLASFALEVTDVAGRTVSPILTWNVLANSDPTGSLTVTGPTTINAGTSTTVQVHAEDVEGLASVTLLASAPAVEESQTVPVSGGEQWVDFTVTASGDALEGGTIELWAEIIDTLGTKVTVGPATVTVTTNEMPSGAVSFVDGTPASVYPGATVTVSVTATDIEGALSRVALELIGPGVAEPAEQPVSGDEQTVTFAVTVNRDALASQTLTISATVFDAHHDQGSLIGSLSLGILEDLASPEVSVSDLRSLYHAGETLSARIEVTDEVGASSVDVSFDGETISYSDPEPIFTVIREISRELTEARTTTFVVTAHDYHGHTSETFSQEVQLELDTEPSMSMLVEPDIEVVAGTTLQVTVDADDDVGITSIRFQLNGAVSDEQTRTMSLLDAHEVYTYTLPTTLEADQQIQLQVDVTDTFGHIVSDAASITILADSAAPTVTVDLTPAATNDTYTEAETVEIDVTATDNVEVASMRLLIDGVEVATASGDSLSYTWELPNVNGVTSIDLVAEAVDLSGNTGDGQRTVTVEPVDAPLLPNVRFDCPSSGAYLPSGLTDLVLHLTAWEDDPEDGIDRVEVYLDDAEIPFYTEQTSGATVELAVPIVDPLPTVTAEQVVRYRAVAYDLGDRFREAVTEIHVVPSVDLDTAADQSQSFVVLRSGTVTLTEAKTFGGLIVLDGAAINHANAAPGAETAVDLTVNGAVYIQCGGSINASARGYGSGETYPGAVPVGSKRGGSHIGYGNGDSSGQTSTGSTYGSIYRPHEPGGSGYNNDYGSYGSPGGGVIRLTAGNAVVDGMIVANGGASSCYRPGAGGSVWMTVAGSLSGAGDIAANGGSRDSCGDIGGGGGGAVAIEYGSIADNLLANVKALGGRYWKPGGAGTVYLRDLDDPEAVCGELVVSGHADASGELTVLPALGSGTIQLVGGVTTLLSPDSTDAIPAYFVGHWVEVSNDLGQTSFWRIASVDSRNVTFEPNPTAPAIEDGDHWQGVYRFDSMQQQDHVRIRSADPIRVSGTIEVSGANEADQLSAGTLILHQDAILSSPFLQPLELEAGHLTVESGAKINASGRGYTRGTTYPDASPAGAKRGGSHMGYGNGDSSSTPSSPGSTFGSVYRPQEPGGAGRDADYGTNGSSGGGVIRISAGSALVEGSIVADGGVSSCDRPGAGGSIWMTVADSLSGDGVISAVGGSRENCGDIGGGGGGAVAISYGSASGSVIDNLQVMGGRYWRPGGAGTIYLQGPGSVYGDLVVSNHDDYTGEQTVLPALGSGTIQLGGSSGTDIILSSGESSDSIPAYFIGHWVEISDDSGALEGTWRIATIDQRTVTFEVDQSNPLPEQLSDYNWQGVYRFDNCSLGERVRLHSDDPIRLGGQLEITSLVETDRIIGHDMVVRTGGTVYPPTGGSLSIELSGDLVVEPDGFISATGRGYAAETTYPDASKPGDKKGGSHIGYGNGDKSSSSSPGSTYGSIYRPQEAGAGGDATAYSPGMPGGGVIRISAVNATIDGSIIADGSVHGSNCYRPGAGGSIWMTVTSQLDGTGLIEANGGSKDDCSSTDVGGGGGGAVAIEYGTLGAQLTIQAQGGRYWRPGGAGTVYLRDLDSPESLYGELVVSNHSDYTGEQTVLPALGSGTIELGGDTGTDIILASLTDTNPIPDYFVGHWVELVDAEGHINAWRIASISSRAVTFEPNADSQLPVVQDGTPWQGVYMLDSLQLGERVRLKSSDPIRVTGQVEVTGLAETNGFRAHDLVVQPNANLYHPSGESLVVELSGDLLVAADGAINVTGRGYAAETTYPGASRPGDKKGGSHLGYGNGDRYSSSSPGSTYGSVYRPQEPGAGGDATAYSSGMPGGGVVRISAVNATINGSIMANGSVHWSYCYRPGGGGSIWMTVSNLLDGSGLIEANGGSKDECSSTDVGGGGGGTVAIEYGSLGAQLSIQAHGGRYYRPGGAGTVYLSGPDSTWGDLVVDNSGNSGEWTAPPPLGFGTAASGSGSLSDGSGQALLLTGRSTDIPAYMLGHWVQITSALGIERGAWPIVGIEGTTLTLGASDLGDPVVAEGDSWRGLYRFDKVTVRQSARLVLSDLIEVGEWIEDGSGSISMPNQSPPAIDTARVSLYAYNGAFEIVGSAGALVDSDGIVTATATVLTTGAAVNLSVDADGSFAAAQVTGGAGETVVVSVTDGHSLPMTSTAEIGVLPANSGDPVVNQALIELVSRSIVGQAGAVYDDELPLTVVAHNLSTGIEYSTTAAADGSFSVAVEGVGGDEILLTISDGHPDVGTVSYSVGILEGNPAPEIDRGLIAFEFVAPLSGEGGTIPAHYRMTAQAGAFTDDDSQLSVQLTHVASGEQWSQNLWGPDWGGVVFNLESESPQWGDEVSLEVTDDDANEPATSSETFNLPPDNYGPPEITSYQISIRTMGLGYQLTGEPGWAEDGDWPLTAWVVNETTSWTSPVVSVPSADDRLVIAIQGSSGDAITLVARDGHGPETWEESSVSLGTLSGTGFTSSDQLLDGHTVAVVASDQLALLDGGTAISSLSEDGLIQIAGGLTGAVDLTTSQALGDAPVALDGGDLVAWWWVAGEPPTATAIRMSLSPGTLQSVEVMGDQLLVSAEESDGIHLYKVPRLALDGAGGTLGPACGTVQSLLLSSSVARSALALIPAPDGQIGVILDDAAAELRLVDPVTMTEAATVDLDWPFVPTWVEGAGAEVIVGRDNGGVEVWRWTEAGLALLAEWQPDTGMVRAAERMGEQLWLGLDSGDLVQVSLAIPDVPVTAGSLAIGYPVHDLSRVPLTSSSESSGLELMVAATAADGTAGRLVRLEVYGIPSGIPTELVSWGHEASGDAAKTWVEVAPLEADIASVHVEWQSSGYTQTCWDADSGCRFTYWSDETAPPLVWVVSNSGVATVPVPASNLVLRSFDGIGGPELVDEGVLPGPDDPCTVEAGLYGEQGDDSWAAYLQGSGEVSYSSTGTSTPSCTDCKLSGPDLLSVQGQAVSLLPNGSSSIVVAADDLEVWSLSSIADPVLSGSIEVFGTEPITATGLDSSGSNLLLANDTVGLFSMVDSGLYLTVEDQTLEDLEGSIIGLGLVHPEAGDLLVVMTDAGTAGRLYLYEVGGSVVPVKSLAVSQLDLDATMPQGVALMVTALCNQYGGCYETIVVVRDGWGIEAFDSSLQQLATLEIPGEPSRVAPWGDSHQLAIACGSLGVAIVSDPLVNPQLSFSKSNAEPPGQAIGLTGQGMVVTPDGFSWPPPPQEVPQ